MRVKLEFEVNGDEQFMDLHDYAYTALTALTRRYPMLTTKLIDQTTLTSPVIQLKGESPAEGPFHEGKAPGGGIAASEPDPLAKDPTEDSQEA